MSKHLPSLAVVVPSKNRPQDLEVVIQGLLEQTVWATQLIVVDQSSDDESERRVASCFDQATAVARESIQLTYIRDPKITGLTAARNRSLPLLRADVVLFLDDDVVLQPNFVEEILTTYARYPQAAGVSGIVTNYLPPSAIYKYWIRIFALGVLHDDRQPIYWNVGNLETFDPVRVSRLGGGLMSFRTAAIRGTEFDAGLSGACDGEDVDFCIRLGKQAVLLITPRARLVHKASPVGRSGDHWLLRHARTNWYLYQRNWNHGIMNRVCFAWLNLGYGLAAGLSCLRRVSLAPCKALLKMPAMGTALARRSG